MSSSASGSVVVPMVTENDSDDESMSIKSNVSNAKKAKVTSTVVTIEDSTEEFKNRISELAKTYNDPRLVQMELTQRMEQVKSFNFKNRMNSNSDTNSKQTEITQINDARDLYQAIRNMMDQVMGPVYTLSVELDINYQELRNEFAEELTKTIDLTRVLKDKKITYDQYVTDNGLEEGWYSSEKYKEVIIIQSEQQRVVIKQKYEDLFANDSTEKNSVDNLFYASKYEQMFRNEFNDRQKEIESAVLVKQKKHRLLQEEFENYKKELEVNQKDGKLNNETFVVIGLILENYKTCSLLIVDKIVTIIKSMPSIENKMHESVEINIEQHSNKRLVQKKLIMDPLGNMSLSGILWGLYVSFNTTNIVSYFAYLQKIMSKQFNTSEVAKDPNVIIRHIEKMVKLAKQMDFRKYNNLDHLLIGSLLVNLSKCKLGWVKELQKKIIEASEEEVEVEEGVMSEEMVNNNYYNELPCFNAAKKYINTVAVPIMSIGNSNDNSSNNNNDDNKQQQQQKQQYRRTSSDVHTANYVNAQEFWNSKRLIDFNKKFNRDINLNDNFYYVSKNTKDNPSNNNKTYNMCYTAMDKPCAGCSNFIHHQDNSNKCTFTCWVHRCKRCNKFGHEQDFCNQAIQSGGGTINKTTTGGAGDNRGNNSSSSSNANK